MLSWRDGAAAPIANLSEGAAGVFVEAAIAVIVDSVACFWEGRWDPFA